MGNILGKLEKKIETTIMGPTALGSVSVRAETSRKATNAWRFGAKDLRFKA